MDINQPIISLLTLTGVVWISQSSLTNGWKYVNEIRNSIIVGKIDGEPIDFDTSKILLENDYLPLARGMVLSGLVFGLVICAGTIGVTGIEWWWKVVYFFFGFSQIIRSIESFRLYKQETIVMKKYISSRQKSSQPFKSV